MFCSTTPVCAFRSLPPHVCSTLFVIPNGGVLLDWHTQAHLPQPCWDFFYKMALEQSLVDILLMDLSFFMDLFFHNDLAHLGKLGFHMTLRIEHLNSFLICSQSF